ncbi:hypothetical protein MASR2M64_18280 [Candidatus Cloacimonadota bacterium]
MNRKNNVVVPPCFSSFKRLLINPQTPLTCNFKYNIYAQICAPPPTHTAKILNEI